MNAISLWICMRRLSHTTRKCSRNRKHENVPRRGLQNWNKYRRKEKTIYLKKWTVRTFPSLVFNKRGAKKNFFFWWKFTQSRYTLVNRTKRLTFAEWWFSTQLKFARNQSLSDKWRTDNVSNGIIFMTFGFHVVFLISLVHSVRLLVTINLQ